MPSHQNSVFNVDIAHLDCSCGGLSPSLIMVSAFIYTKDRNEQKNSFDIRIVPLRNDDLMGKDKIPNKCNEICTLHLFLHNVKLKSGIPYILQLVPMFHNLLC